MPEKGGERVPSVFVQVVQSFYDRSYGMKLRKVGDTYAETPARADELKKKGLVVLIDKPKNKKAAADKEQSLFCLVTGYKNRSEATRPTCH